jgi:hypothetical protein
MVERKLRRCRLTDDRNGITGRDLRKRTLQVGQRDFFHRSTPADISSCPAGHE